MSLTLTKRQQQILEFIERAALDQGYPPTRAEICTEFGFRSPNAAEDHLRALARKGAITLRQGVSRGIQLPATRLPSRPSTIAASSAAPSMLSLPLVGRVAAGLPILAVENIDQHFTVDRQLFKPVPDYLLRVYGLSMRDAGIIDGDLLAIHRSPEASSQQIVVARIDEEVTVKRYQRRGRLVRLIAENKDFDPIEVDLSRSEFSIEGIVVGVIRPHLNNHAEVSAR